MSITFQDFWKENDGDLLPVLPHSLCRFCFAERLLEGLSCLKGAHFYNSCKVTHVDRHGHDLAVTFLPNRAEIGRKEKDPADKTLSLDVEFPLSNRSVAWGISVPSHVSFLNLRTSTAACQAFLSMGISQARILWAIFLQGIFHSGIEPASPVWQADSYFHRGSHGLG